ncbi:MAG: hypothetical protein WC624_04950 [Candidatus Margulisiibacteriota bacterium]
MKITNQTSANSQIKDTYLDSVFQQNTTKNNASFPSQNPINSMEDVTGMAHKVLGGLGNEVNCLA